jgi:Zn-finger nucleic acid-binding protein
MPATIQCPECGDATTQHSVGGLVMDVCSNCGGIWFGSQELGKVLEQGIPALDELMGFEPVESHAARPRSTYSCPICKIPLHRNQLSGEPDVTVNTCYECGGLYLEASALAKLDDVYKKLGDAQAPTISAEARAAGAALDTLTIADQERVAYMNQMLRWREMNRYGYRGGLWL